MRRALNAFNDIGIAARDCVAKRLDHENTAGSGTSGRTDIMQELYDIHLGQGSKTEFDIRDVEQGAYSALFAGSDTTAIGLRSVFYQLMKNPEVYRSVQQEIDDAIEKGRLS